MCFDYWKKKREYGFKNIIERGFARALRTGLVWAFLSCVFHLA
jgi:hypothetical protein